MQKPYDLWEEKWVKLYNPEDKDDRSKYRCIPPTQANILQMAVDYWEQQELEEIRYDSDNV